jgi:hypothetical protein
MKRIVDVARLQLAGITSLLVWPLSILALTFAINLVLFSVIGDDIEGGPVTGGLLSVYVVTFILGTMTVPQYLPYALGIGVTRREFAAATAVLIVVQAFAYGLLLTLLSVIEDRTRGWGIDMPFFAVPGIIPDWPGARFPSYAVPMMVLTLTGACLGVAYMRWQATGVFGVFTAGLVLLGLLAILLTWRGWWGNLGRWLVDQSEVALLVGWPMLLLAALAAAGWAGLRHVAV